MGTEAGPEPLGRAPSFEPLGRADMVFAGWLAHHKGCALCLTTAHGCAWGAMLLRCAFAWRRPRPIEAER